MLEMTRGELFIVVFVTVAIVSAPWWGRAGAVVGRILAERAVRKTPTGRQLYMPLASDGEEGEGC